MRNGSNAVVSRRECNENENGKTRARDEKRQDKTGQDAIMMKKLESGEVVDFVTRDRIQDANGQG